MVYIQRNIPQPNQLLPLTLVNFSGGLNNRMSTIADNESNNIRNMRFSDDQVLEKRYGTKLYMDNVETGKPITFLDYYQPYDDVSPLIYSDDQDLYVNGVKHYLPQGEVSGANFQGRYFFVDGSSIQVYGTFPFEPSTYIGIVGTPTQFGYRLMEVVSPPSGYVPLDETHFQGKTVYDYTNGHVWYEPCKREMDDTSLGACVVPSKVDYIVSHQGRLFISGQDNDNDNVFITDIQNPYYFPVYLPLQPTPNEDKTVALIVYNDAVIIGRQHEIYAIKGNTNRLDVEGDQFRLEKLNTHTGFSSNKAMARAHNYLLFLGSDGNAYALQSSVSDSTQIVTQVISKQVDFFRPPINATQADIVKASSIFFEDEWMLSLGDKVMVYSYRTRGWTMYDGLHATSFTRVGNDVVWGNKNGQLVTFDKTNYTDLGFPYKALWSSKNFDLGIPSTYKFFREFYLVAHTFNNYTSNIRVSFEADHMNVKDEIIVTSRISLWGRAKFGDVFNNNDIVTSSPIYIGRRARYLRFVLSNGYDNAGKVTGYSDLQTIPNKVEGLVAFVENESEFYVYESNDWQSIDSSLFNQPMRIYEVNGDYEYRGKR